MTAPTIDGDMVLVPRTVLRSLYSLGWDIDGRSEDEERAMEYAHAVVGTWERFPARKQEAGVAR